MYKKAVTISGGFDSGCLPFILEEEIKQCDLVFFEYQQLYLQQEKEKASQFALFLHQPLLILSCPRIQHDQERRNFLFLAELKQRGYQEVVMGNRNFFPFFDEYRDSNWWSLQKMASLLNLQLELPITGWSKKRVIHFLFAHGYSDFYNCYLGNSDYQKCECKNCVELRRVLKND